MKQETILKIFGTGQITIPKQWRDFFGADTVMAVFDESKKNISIKPIKMVELEDTKWIAANELAGDLDEMKLNKDLKKEFLAGYKQSDFYQAKLKNKKKNGI